MNPARRQIIAFPKQGNLYTELLYAEVEKQGLPVVEGRWSLGWFRQHVKPGDLVHIHWPSFIYFEPASGVRTWLRLAKMAALLRFLKGRGALVVWTAHNLYPHDGDDRVRAHHLGRRLIVSSSNYVIAHGRSAATLVANEFQVPDSRLRIAPHGHWIDHYPNVVTRAQARERLGVSPDEFVYLHVGRCRPYKGLEALMTAFPQVAPPAELIIAGKFSSSAYQREILARADTLAKVLVVPRSIADDELQLYLNACDCVVLPYRAVLTSGTALLALSFGRPVIAPDMGAMRDHVAPGSGILYDPAQPDGLLRAMQDIRSRRFDAEAIKSQAREFSWSRLAGLLLDMR